MSVEGLDHVAVAVESLEEAIRTYENVLRTEPHVETVESQGARIGVFDFGETRLELLEPLSEESGLHDFLDRRGEGLHHVAVRTDDIESELDHVDRVEGVTCIDRSPREGAQGYRIAFLHPDGLHGTLLEFAQPPTQEVDEG